MAGAGKPTTDRQRLVALDADDLAVISAHVQCAAVDVRDIVWRQSEKRLVIGMRRPDWDSVLDAPSDEDEPPRLVAALRFDRVLACKARNVAPDAAEPLALLGVEFHVGDAPGGSVVLMFDNEAGLRLDVECLECELADFGADDLT